MLITYNINSNYVLPELDIFLAKLTVYNFNKGSADVNHMINQRISLTGRDYVCHRPTADDYIYVITHFYHMHILTNYDNIPALHFTIPKAVYKIVYPRVRFYVENHIPIIFIIRVETHKNKPIYIPTDQQLQLLRSEYLNIT